MPTFRNVMSNNVYNLNQVSGFPVYCEFIGLSNLFGRHWAATR